MKKLVTIFIALALSVWVMGQTPVGTGQTYTTLKSAFDAINSGALTGAVVLQLVSSTTETASAVLNATGGSASYTSVTIYPAGSGYIISGNIAGPLISLNGASNVTLDGRVNQSGNVKDLIISNTNTGGQTLAHFNDAITNKVKYCILMGVNSSASSGVVIFSTSTGTLGNSGNTIEYCDIRDGATTPANLIYSSGTTTALNINNTISACNLFNWFLASTTSQTGGIYLSTASSAWTIIGNSFYQTVARAYTSTGIVSCISIINTTSGVNFSITNNYFGGSAPGCGGTAMTLNGTNTAPFRLLYITHAVGTASTISGNTFQNIAMTTTSGSSALSMISHLNGNVLISGNTFGSQSTTGSITLTNSGSSTSQTFLMINGGTGGTPSNSEIANNSFGGITVSASSTGSTSFRLVSYSSVATSTINIHHNTIGGTVANSIQQNTNSSFFGIVLINQVTGAIVDSNIVRNLTRNNTGNANFFCGIYNQLPSSPTTGGGIKITNNEIYNLTTNSTNTQINNAASIVGISMTVNLVGGSNISGNTIYNLTNTNTTVAGFINGMYFGTAAAPQSQTVISKNRIYGFNLASATAGMCGIFVPNTGNALVYNNQIRLGLDASGNSITTPLAIYGIWKASSANVGIYYNSVFIGGSGVTGAVPTVAYYRTTSGTADTVMNNIFYNARSNGAGTGTHYGIYLMATTALACNYNDLFADGTGGALGSDNLFVYTTLPSWQTATGLDANSISANPLYVSPANLMLQNASPAIGIAYKLPQVADDFPGNPRGSVTTMGAYELVSPTSPSSLTWTGAVSENWHNPFNWNGTSTLPNATTDVTIPAGLTNYPTLAISGFCNNIVMQSNVSGTASLLDKGLLTINGTATVERYFSGNDPDWHLVSQPVTAATANVFLAMYLQSFSETTNSYSEIIDPATLLNVMEGYGLYSTLAAANTVTYTGNLNLGTQSKGFTALNQGWNLLGNPFVSSINWENVTIPPEMTNEVHYIEAATGNDLSYVQGTGGTGSQYIPPMQGFFIKATAPGTFSAGDAARSHSGASNFYKAGTTELLILETSGDQYSDKMLIHFNELAGAEHDGKYDAYKRLSFSNPKLPQVFTYTPSGVRLSVNGMPETAAVPVGFTAGTTDSYSIKMVEPGNFTTVLLEDKMNGVITDLLKYDYSFNYIEGDNENRFLLHFAPLSVDETGKALANIYALDHTVYVNLIDFTQGDIFIYNVSGQLVATSPAAKGMNKVFLRNPGHYVVKVVTETETLVQKVFINQ